eukprot:gene15061-biopygen23158
MGCSGCPPARPNQRADRVRQACPTTRRTPALSHAGAAQGLTHPAAQTNAPPPALPAQPRVRNVRTWAVSNLCLPGNGSWCLCLPPETIHGLFPVHRGRGGTFLAYYPKITPHPQDQEAGVPGGGDVRGVTRWSMERSESDLARRSGPGPVQRGAGAGAGAGVGAGA